MSQESGTAIACLVIGILLGAWVLLRIRSGKSYISRPAMRVSRTEDPFSFWLSVAPMLVLAVALIAMSAMHLLKV